MINDKQINIGSVKWLLERQASAFFVIQSFLVCVIFVSLAVAVVRYQNTVLLTMEPKGLNKSPPNSLEGSFVKESKPLSFYMDLVGGRDIFHLGASQPIFSSPPTGSTAPAGIDFTTRYIVQGIIVDKNPQAIIQDTQSMKTFFLHRKDLLDKAALVDIRGNQVIFNLDGQTVELIKK